MSQEALHAILATLHHTDPLSMRKAELLAERTEILRLVVAALEGDQPPEPRYGAVDPRHVLALRLVIGYEGTNNFMVSLRRGIDTYGGLTAPQVEAVLAPPSDGDYERMSEAGVDASTVIYRFQAYEAIKEAQRRARAAARDG